VEWSDPPRYALPDPDHGLKAAEHIVGPLTDPDEDGTVNQQSIDRVAEWVRYRFPNADPTPADAQPCLYTITNDENFILERHGKVVVGSPCSGHGFKFAPVIGQRLAGLAQEVL
jgi:sarcosine oxidase